MPRSTIGSTVERIRRQLASAFRYEVSVLGSLLTSSATTVQFTSLIDLPPSLREGAVLSIDNEVLRVLGVDTAAKTALVLRGWQDSDPVAHANSSEVWINPRFTAMDIYDTLLAELQAWGPDLYRIVTAELAVAEGAQTLALPAQFVDAYGIVGLNTKQTASADFPFTSTTWPAASFRLLRAEVGFSAAPLSGLLIRFINDSAIGSGRQLAGTALVQMAMPFDLTATALTDDLITDIGLQPSMLDVLDLGVKWRLMGDQENQRSARVAQDTPRMAEETPAMAAFETAQRMFPIYARRKTEETNKLRHRYAVMAG